MTLNPGQQEALDAVLTGQNIFLTGPGGTGKSFLIQRIVEELTERKKKVAVTALTGCAALLLGKDAKTIHSWAGIGLGRDKAATIVAAMKKYRHKVQRRWLLTNTIIIDEVSMMTPEILELLDTVGKLVRRDERKPFGGLQIILVGDFFQLPPVVKADDTDKRAETAFVFESPLWQTLNLKVCRLTQVVRQDDPTFHKVLEEARIGKLSKESLQVLQSRQTSEWQTLKIKPTLLFSRRAEVEMINEQNFKALPGPIKRYEIKTLFDTTVAKGLTEQTKEVQFAVSKMDRDAPYKVELQLKLGAQVMLIYNLDQEAGLVNGSRGVVEGFDAETGLPLVLFKGHTKAIPVGVQSWESEELDGVKRSQIPLILAYAITIHKCVSEDTLLSIPNKGMVPIHTLSEKNQLQYTITTPKNIEVVGLSENKSIIEVYKGAIEDGLRLETLFGYELTGSYRHPVLIYNSVTHNFEWKKLPEISIGEYMVLKRNSKVEGSYYRIDNIIFTNGQYNKQITLPDYLDEDIGYLIGLLVGDGSINKKSYRFDFISADKDIMDRYIDILQQKFNITIKSKLLERKTPTWRCWFYSKQLVELFSIIGYTFGAAPKKQIPSRIFTSPLSVQKAVIQGLYDTDGGVSNSAINFTTTSYILGKQIQQILLNNGIPVSRHVLKDENIQKNHKKSYRLNISGASALKFVSDVGFRCERKKQAAENRFKKTDKLRRDNKSQSFEIPNGDILITKLRDEIRGNLKRINSAKITSEGNKILSSIIYKKQKLRCESLEIIVKSIVDISQYPTGKFIKYMYDNGVLIDTVKCIDKVSDIQMYDIGVSPLNTSGILPDGHDFIAGGFVNHNCQGSTLNAALIDIGPSTFEVGQAYVALSRVKSLDSLYVFDLDPLAFKAHPKVCRFYDSL